MNIKINKEQYDRLNNSGTIINTYVFGSHLFGNTTENSDIDVLKIYDSDSFFGDDHLWGCINLELIKNYPNIHAFQYDGENEQTIFMTPQQFWHGIHSGDGIINLDIFIFTIKPDIEQLFTYKIIKSYIGIGKRDLKQANRNVKKHFHAQKMLYIADCLINKKYPEIEVIKNMIYNLQPLDNLILFEKTLRNMLNGMLDTNQIQHYYIPRVGDDLLQTMLDSNNIKEFKY